MPSCSMSRLDTTRKGANSMAKQDKATLKETFQIHWRAYKDIRHFAPGVFAVTAIHSIAKAISPYVTVFFSARIIDELAGLRRTEELIRLVITALISMGCMTLATGLLLRWRNVIADRYAYRKNHLLADNNFLPIDLLPLHHFHGSNTIHRQSIAIQLPLRRFR